MKENYYTEEDILKWKEAFLREQAAQDPKPKEEPIPPKPLTYQEALKDYNKKLDEYDKQVDKLEDEYNEKLDSIRGGYQARIKELKEQIVSIEKTESEEITALAETYRSKVRELKDQLNEDWKGVQALRPESIDWFDFLQNLLR